jgi:hypothetical protein
MSDEDFGTAKFTGWKHATDTGGAVHPDGAPPEPSGIRWCSLRDEIEAVVADCVNADSPDVEERALDRATDRIFALLRARPSEPGTTAR